jgi:hypothetical protein
MAQALNQQKDLMEPFVLDMQAPAAEQQQQQTRGLMRIRI